jgi:hypothetical protein
VRRGTDAVKLDCAFAVGENALFIERFDNGRARIERQRIGFKREFRFSDLFDESFISGRNDDNRAFGDVFAQAARMVEMKMRKADVFYRLVRNGLFDSLMISAFATFESVGASRII